jgi:putative copper export protein
MREIILAHTIGSAPIVELALAAILLLAVVPMIGATKRISSARNVAQRLIGTEWRRKKG